VNAPARLGAFGLVLAVALGGGAALGRAVGPLDTTEADDPHTTHVPGTSTTTAPGAGPQPDPMPGHHG